MSLKLPTDHLKTRSENGKDQLWDPQRKKWVALTAEECVRQYFTHYLIQQKGYPAGLIAHEAGIRLNGTIKRCDTIVYSATGEPILIVEYKSPEVTISQEVFDQIYRYNCVLKVPYLIVSNGFNHFCCRIDYKTMESLFVPQIPSWKELIGSL